MTELLRDPETERVLLSSVLQQPATLRRLLTTEALRPEHFASPAYGSAYAALVKLTDNGDHASRLTLVAELEREGTPDPGRVVESIVAELPEPIGIATYARRVKDLHRRRQLKLAASILADAADRGDAERLAEAESLLTTPDDAEPTTWSGKELAERFSDRLDEPAPEMFRWPFRELDAWTGGGLRRKQIVLIGGWTSAGKSIVYDQILEGLANQGLNCHSYINEMSESERMDRTVARISGVKFADIYRRNLDKEQNTQILSSLPEIKVGMTECAGWTASDIARHIQWNRWDVAGVDILHEIAHREERDLAEIAQTLRAAAKQANCALVACVHLNDNRITAPQRPVPVMRDVRGSGMLVRGADLVLFIHRDDDEDGVPKPTGVLVAAKIRNGQPNVMGVVFQPDRMRFLPSAKESE